MKKFRLLSTDMYALTMSAAYLLLDQHNTKAGFEAFYRRPNPKINSKDDKYVFYGGFLVRELIRDIKRELEDPQLIEKVYEKIKSANSSSNQSTQSGTEAQGIQTL